MGPVGRRCVALAVVGASVAACGGPDAVTIADIDAAATRWETNEPGTYTWRVEGTVDGMGVLYEVLVADGEGLPVDVGVTDDPRELFDRMRTAIGDGTEVRATFDELGYPLDIEIGDTTDLRTTELRAVEAPESCPSATPGSATDLTAEPPAWALLAGYERWADAEGCPVRLDVVSEVRGAAHCDWDGIVFLTVSTPVGSSVIGPDGSLTGTTFVWDPEDSLGELDDVDRGRRLDVTDLPAGVTDTGMQRDGATLWLDPDDPSSAYVVRGDRADRYVADPRRRIVCA